jgi:lysozyme
MLKKLGYGHNCDQRLDCGDLDAPITEEEGDELLRSDLSDYEACTCELPNASKLNLNQYSALVSFAFNSGCGALEQYIGSYMDNSDFSGICNDLPGLNTLDGYLVSRREQESGLCSTGTETPCGC